MKITDHRNLRNISMIPGKTKSSLPTSHLLLQAINPGIFVVLSCLLCCLVAKISLETASFGKFLAEKLDPVCSHCFLKMTSSDVGIHWSEFRTSCRFVQSNCLLHCVRHFVCRRKSISFCHNSALGEIYMTFCLYFKIQHQP